MNFSFNCRDSNGTIVWWMIETFKLKCNKILLIVFSIKMVLYNDYLKHLGSSNEKNLMCL